MKEMVIVLKPEKLECLKEVLDEHGCTGMSISSVMGCGTQRGDITGDNTIKGFKTNINLLPKIKVEVVIPDRLTEELILAIREKISTGHVGDGKIFLRTIDDVVRVRTGERGEKAI